MKRALLLLMAACGGSEPPREFPIGTGIACSADVDGEDFEHWLVEDGDSTSVLCAAGAATGEAWEASPVGASSAPCTAGEWAFAFNPETQISTATRVFRRYELSCRGVGR